MDGGPSEPFSIFLLTAINHTLTPAHLYVWLYEGSAAKTASMGNQSDAMHCNPRGYRSLNETHSRAKSKVP